MKTFKDKNGRDWLITIDVAAVKRCRNMLGVDLYGLVGKDGAKGLGELLRNPVELVDVVYVLCRDDAEKLGIDDLAFGRGIGGDSLRFVADAFLEALVDFFPEPRQRAGLKALIEKGRKVGDLMMDLMDEKIQKLDAESVARKLINSSGAAPESSESTPDLLPFENSP